MDINSFVIGLAKGKKSGSGYFSTKENEAGGLTYAFKAKESEGGELNEKDVNFYDYDGTLLHSYTVAEAQALTELPELPTQEGLTCQGWNYDLETIKDYNGAVDVGAVYITDDGKTRIYIVVTDVEKFNQTIPLYFIQSVANGVVVDWGDGSEPQTTSKMQTTSAGVMEHLYTEVGEYVVTLEPVGNCTIKLGGDGTTTAYENAVFGGTKSNGCSQYISKMVRKVHVGRNVIALQRKCFSNYRYMETVTVPMEVTDWDENAFYACVSLKALVIPNGVTSIYENTCYDCCLSKILSIPDSVTKIGKYAFRGIHSERVIIPRGVTFTTSSDSHLFYNSFIKTAIVSKGVSGLANSMFYGCNRLKRVKLPETLTAISSGCFNGCSSIEEMYIPNSVTTISQNAFNGCSQLENIELPNGLTTVGDQAFYGCPITRIKLPTGITSCGDSVVRYCRNLELFEIHKSKATIADYEFNQCTSLIYVKIPSSVTRIGANAFDGCGSLLHIDFTEHTSVPTLPYTSTFSNVCAYVKIYVPAALVDEWKAATNWASIASHIVAV